MLVGSGANSTASTHKTSVDKCLLLCYYLYMLNYENCTHHSFVHRSLEDLMWQECEFCGYPEKVDPVMTADPEDPILEPYEYEEWEVEEIIQHKMTQEDMVVMSDSLAEKYREVLLRDDSLFSDDDLDIEQEIDNIG